MGSASPSFWQSATTVVRRTSVALGSRLGSVFLRTPRLARAPLVLYRRGLGWLLGPRLLMLEHRGRTSGQWRQVCLEVVDRPTPGTLRIVSGYGPKAQWYRNLVADPHCVVHTGRMQRVSATAQLVPQEEVSGALARYAAERPQNWEILSRVVGAEVPADQTLGDWLPMVDLVLDEAAFADRGIR